MKKPNSCPALEGQVHLSGNTQYVRAVGKIFEAGGQPIKNREMRSLAQKGNRPSFATVCRAYSDLQSHTISNI